MSHSHCDFEGGKDGCTSDRSLSLTLRGDSYHVASQPDLLQCDDDRGGGVDLTSAQAVGRGARKGMVIVMPRLPQRGHCQPEHIGGFVVGVETTSAEEVTHEVDTPGHVVDEENTYQSSPQQSGRGAGEGPADEDPDVRCELELALRARALSGAAGAAAS